MRSKLTLNKMKGVDFRHSPDVQCFFTQREVIGEGIKEAFCRLRGAAENVILPGAEGKIK